MLCEHLLKEQFALALGTHASEAKQVFEPVVAEVLHATFEAAYAQRGASILAAQARRACSTSVNAFMETQLADYAALCEQFRQQRPKREKYKGWALLRQVAALRRPTTAAGGSGGSSQAAKRHKGEAHTEGK